MPSEQIICAFQEWVEDHWRIGMEESPDKALAEKYRDIAIITSGLAEEIGEVEKELGGACAPEVAGLFASASRISGVLKRHARDRHIETEMTPERKENLTLEIGDVLVYLAQLCNMNGINISDVLHKTSDKLSKRKGTPGLANYINKNNFEFQMRSESIDHGGVRVTIFTEACLANLLFLGEPFTVSEKDKSISYDCDQAAIQKYFDFKKQSISYREGISRYEIPVAIATREALSRSPWVSRDMYDPVVRASQVHSLVIERKPSGLYYF